MRQCESNRRTRPSIWLRFDIDCSLQFTGRSNVSKIWPTHKSKTQTFWGNCDKWYQLNKQATELIFTNFVTLTFRYQLRSRKKAISFTYFTSEMRIFVNSWRPSGAYVRPWNPYVVRAAHRSLWDRTVGQNQLHSNFQPNTNVFSCDQAALWMVQSVCLSVCLSVCPSVTPFYPSALRAGGVLSSRSGRAVGRAAARLAEPISL